MKPREATALLLVASLLCQVALVSTAVATPEVDKCALLIGISNYLGRRYDLRYCDDDARDIRDALIDYCGFQGENIYLLLDRSATKGNIYEAITEWLDAREGPDTLVVISFSGHGTYGDDVEPIDEEDDFDEYILPYNFPLGYYIRDDEFAEWLSVLESEKIVIILDSCFAGGMAVKGVRTIPKPRAHLKRGDGFFKDVTGSSPDFSVAGRAVALMATTEDGVSYEDPELSNGVFSYYLVDGLAGPADGAGVFAEGDGISAEEDFSYAQPLVVSFTDGEQNPTIADGIEGELYLTAPTAPPEPAVYVALSTDKAEYLVGTATAVLTVAVTDEYGDPISGLAAESFVTTLDGSPTDVAFTKTATSGTYTGDLAISGLSVGTHTVNVTVTDSRPVTGSGETKFKVVTEPSLAVVITAPDSVTQGDTDVEISAEVSNAADAATTTGVTATISLPEGWTAVEPLEQLVGDLAGGTSELVVWHVDIAAEAPLGDQTVSVTAADGTGGYTACGEKTIYVQEKPAMGWIHGRVTNTAGRGIVRVTVEVLRDGEVIATAITNSKGYYTVEEVPVGTYSVRFSKLHYITQTIYSVDVTAGAGTKVNIVLERA